MVLLYFIKFISIKADHIYCKGLSPIQETSSVFMQVNEGTMSSESMLVTHMKTPTMPWSPIRTFHIAYV